MELKTARLLLRPFETSDAEAVYELARHPLVGPAAGWKPHTCVAYSRKIIDSVLSKPYTFAIVLKGNTRPCGCVSLVVGDNAALPLSADEGEIGYWIGKPFWGLGLVPEAVKELLRFGFEDLNLGKIWCGYFEGNDKSRRVQEKCGFSYQRTLYDIKWEATGETKTEHFTAIDRQRWQKSNENYPSAIKESAIPAKGIPKWK